MNDFKYLRTAICIIASFFTFASYGQKIDITGAVLDSINKEPLIGVTVMEKVRQTVSLPTSTENSKFRQRPKQPLYSPASVILQKK